MRKLPTLNIWKKLQN